MFDFRLKVFYTVATRLNFTKAAEELFISQPAVTRHIQEIENYYKVKMFERKSSGISLTPGGEILLHHAKQALTNNNLLELDLNSLSQKHNGKLRIGASTTIAQYVLPELLSGFHKKFKDITISIIIENTEKIEDELQSNKIDFGIIEGYSKNASLKYTEFIKDEIILIAGSENKFLKKTALKITDLISLPMVLREPGSGTLQVVANALKPFGIKISQLKKEMQIGSTESIKSYLLHSDCFAFLSVYSVRKELKSRELVVVDVKGLNIERNFHFIQQKGDLKILPQLFMKYARSYNLK